jgi:hypothetical protein
MFISSSEPNHRLQQVVSQQAAMAKALVAAARSLGVVKRALAAKAQSTSHAEMITQSREFARDAEAVIHNYNRGDGANDPETILILFELFLLRDVSTQGESR